MGHFFDYNPFFFTEIMS